MDQAFETELSQLKRDFKFREARAELEKKAQTSLSPDDRTWIQQQLVVCTYKDEELPTTQRLDDAEAILEGIGLREPTTSDAETLALGGAVYERRWETAGHLEFLHEALSFYLAAWTRGTDDEKKLYAAVNAAYLLDVLAGRARSIARRTGTEIPPSVTYAVEAETLRLRSLVLARKMELGDASLATNYWHQATLAELHLGLGSKDEQHYAQAESAFRVAATSAPSDWELQTTFQQAKALLRCQDVPPPNATSVATLAPPWRAIAALLGASAHLALATSRGKVGLALSGGGFRASLFHLGVLARLADVDALRSVEVISTVSGGSIVGAHYYLELQRQLETKQDQALSAEEYIFIVHRVQRQFVRGVQRNLRLRALGNLRANLKVAFTKSYTYSRRLGELYERHLYRRVEDGRGEDERPMASLLISPADAPQGFKPKFSNWRRRAKVPIILFNATSLNSGHNWQFTARSMGEPPGRLNTDVDANLRYRRLNYEQAPTPELQRFRLGYAVAASACVPGLFEPIVLSNLYESRTVRLADGGVHDNQGIAGLLDEGCTLMLVSDASGQMDDQAHPANDRVGVPLRSNSILMDRVREAEYEDLNNRVDSHALQGLMFVHLKQGLGVEPLDWIGAEKAPPASHSPAQVRDSDSRTDYGIDKDLQRLLAGLRTDLDSFTEVEANALMLSGYLMTERQLQTLDADHQRTATTPGSTWAGLDVHAPRGAWPFLALKELMSRPRNDDDPQRADLERQLAVGSALLFKAWRLTPALRYVSYLLGAGAVLAAAWLLVRYWAEPIGFTLGSVSIAVFLFVLGLVLPASRWLRPAAALQDNLVKFGLAFAAFALTWLHLTLIERFFLRAGRLDRLLKRR